MNTEVMRPFNNNHKDLNNKWKLQGVGNNELQIKKKFAYNIRRLFFSKRKAFS